MCSTELHSQHPLYVMLVISPMPSHMPGKRLSLGYVFCVSCVFFTPNTKPFYLPKVSSGFSKGKSSFASGNSGNLFGAGVKHTGQLGQVHVTGQKRFENFESCKNNRYKIKITACQTNTQWFFLVLFQLKVIVLERSCSPVLDFIIPSCLCFLCSLITARATMSSIKFPFGHFIIKSVNEVFRLFHLYFLVS